MGEIEAPAPLAAARSLTCSSCNSYLFNKPRQAPCGDRICGECFEKYQRETPGGVIKCPRPWCGAEFKLEKCFRDKAAELELASSVLGCSNTGCPWTGDSQHYNDHLQSCKYYAIECPNSGCSERLPRNDMKVHLTSCKFNPVKCLRCGTQVVTQDIDHHTADECAKANVECPNGCGDSPPRDQLKEHIMNTCPLQFKDCQFSHFGCRFRGNAKQLTAHNNESTTRHTLMLAKADNDKARNDAEQKALAKRTDTQLTEMDQQLADLRKSVAQMKSEMFSRLQPLMASVVKMESAVAQLQEGFGEMALIVQSLQATSYNGCFIWKIPEVARRRREAKLGKVISLYSAPFYTGHHGYKMCLRLYMDGDGTGKGSHLSFFLTLMKGEYDALLVWPFRPTVSLILLDQDRQKDIVQSFRPDPSSSSFQRPRNEMNVASGCPQFTPLSVLESPSYVKDDTLFMKCKIDITGLDPT